MKKPMMPLVILPLLASPLLLGGAWAGTSDDEAARIVGPSSAVAAADLVLYSLQNWSAPGLTGASWIETPAARGDMETTIRRAVGGAPPQVRVEAIEVDYLAPGKRGKGPCYRVVLDVHVQSLDRLEVAAAMLESFCETVDAHNGELDADIGDVTIDPSTRTLHAPHLVVELPVTPMGGAPPARPLTEILRRIGADASLLGSVRIEPAHHRFTGKPMERFFDLELEGGDDELTVASCGSLLHRLGEGEGALPVAQLSLRRRRGDDDHAEGWRLKASLLVAGDGE